MYLFLSIQIFKYFFKQDDNHSKIKNQCFHHAHHQYMMNYFQESVHIVQENMANITHCYSTEYK